MVYDPLVGAAHDDEVVLGEVSIRSSNNADYWRIALYKSDSLFYIIITTICYALSLVEFPVGQTTMLIITL